MSAKSKDTTKTAHVMNLLRKNTANAEAPQTEAPAEVAAESVSVKAAPVKHPIITSLNEEAAVSLEIKDALEQELEKSERSAVTPSAELQPQIQETLPEEDKQSVKEERSYQATTGENDSGEEPCVTPKDDAEPVEETVEETPKKAEEATPAEESVKEIFNVMQVMVDESAQKYMTMFGLCDCPRCRADVRAIALNNLQPKYVVMEEGEYIPRITLYEQQFRVPVTAQILRACSIVAESPRHNLP